LCTVFVLFILPSNYKIQPTAGAPHWITSAPAFVVLESGTGRMNSVPAK